VICFSVRLEKQRKTYGGGGHEGRPSRLAPINEPNFSIDRAIKQN
jgi:hypothetical protein